MVFLRRLSPTMLLYDFFLHMERDEARLIKNQQVLKLLQRLSQVGSHCTRDINLDDEAFEIDEGSLSLVVYNVSGFPG